jgi:hypothetical protein
MRPLSPRHVVLALSAAGAAFGVVSAVQAAIPSANGVIHGCYQFSPAGTSKGTLRVVDAARGETCRFDERPLSWNQTGPAGPTGPQGATGTTGPTGAAGLAGPTSLLTGYTIFVTHPEDDLIVHRVTAAEEGLAILTDPFLVNDYDGRAGGTTNVVCALVVNGVGTEQEVVVSDDGNPELGHGATASATNVLRVNLVQGDEVKVACFTRYLADENEASVSVQLLMERVAS